MALHQYRSNHVERLARALASVVREPLANPLERELVVVQGPGMERWLSMQLSERLSIWANPWFPFPRTLIELCLDACLGKSPESAAVYKPAALQFLIARILPSLLDAPELQEVRRYLGDETDGERMLSLCGTLARLYDQYLIYRPDLLLSWEASSEPQFQAAIWRAVREVAGPGHMAERLQQFQSRAKALDLGPSLQATLPSRLHVFGISTLPPSFLFVLTSVAQVLDVHFFALTPTPEYYGDLTRKLGSGHDMPSLLANLGRMGRELTEQLADIDKIEIDLFEAKPHDSILHTIQADLMNLTVRGPGAEAPVSISERDLSLRVHACHSPEREIEVLSDQLRARFEADDSLRPQDVVVFAPDIERYIPAIESIFGAPSARSEHAIPYRVADRRASRVSEVTDTLLSLLDLCSSRFYLSDALDLLHRSPVRGRFDLDDAELASCERWLVRAGARWAMDANHRARVGQPELSQNSLRFALDRLLLGISTRSGQTDPFVSIAPEGELEGESAQTLAKLLRYSERLFDLSTKLVGAHPASTWSTLLGEGLSTLLSDEGDFALGHFAVRTALASIASDAALAGFEGPMPLAALRRMLAERIDQTRENSGFLSGGVTFCEHVPMRAIPFRVVCMVGLDDESFPRRSARPSFDLIAKHPRLGDRSTRDDDRQLFLEALLSARDALIITYCGRSPKDDTLRPPSVLLDQLLRVVDRHVALRGERALLLGLEGGTVERLNHAHALSRFDARYFRTPRDLVYFSYDKSAADVARVWLEDKPVRVPAFIQSSLPSEAPADHELTLERLSRFLRMPAKYFLQSRLSVFLPRELDPIEDREPLAPDALERWEVGSELLANPKGLTPEQHRERLRLQGRLPLGTLGKVWLREVESTKAAIEQAVVGDAPSPPLPIAIDLPECQLVGSVGELFGTKRIERSFSTPKTKHLLAAWVKHLALCAAYPTLRFESVLVGREKDAAQTFCFKFEPRAHALLADLTLLYRIGASAPLPFFVDASDKYMEAVLGGKPPHEALQRAGQKAGTTEMMRDLDDPYVRQVFGDLTAEDLAVLQAPGKGPELSFVALSERILGPMLENLQETTP